MIAYLVEGEIVEMKELSIRGVTQVGPCCGKKSPRRLTYAQLSFSPAGGHFAIAAGKVIHVYSTHGLTGKPQLCPSVKWYKAGLDGQCVVERPCFMGVMLVLPQVRSRWVCF